MRKQHLVVVLKAKMSIRRLRPSSSTSGASSMQINPFSRSNDANWCLTAWWREIRRRAWWSQFPSTWGRVSISPVRHRRQCLEILLPSLARFIVTPFRFAYPIVSLIAPVHSLQLNELLPWTKSLDFVKWAKCFTPFPCSLCADHSTNERSWSSLRSWCVVAPSTSNCCLHREISALTSKIAWSKPSFTLSSLSRCEYARISCL
mgnify:CR=1 FL=1